FSGARRSPLLWLGGLLVVYLGYPLVAFVVRLITSPQRGFHEPGLFPALWVSVSGATISLAIVTVLGVPLAYLLARSTGPISTIVGTVVQIPLALPPLMSGIVLVYLIGPYTFLGQLFGEHLTNSFVGVVIAMTFVSSPFLIVSSRAAFASLDRGMLDVAAALGHADAVRFFRVAVPTAGHGIRAGMLLTWLRAFGEYGAVVILAYNPASLPIYTENQFSGRGLPTTLAPTALALGVAVVVVVLSRAHVVRPAPRRRGTITLHAPEMVTPRPVRFELDHHLGTFHLHLAHQSRATHLGILGPSGSGKTALLRCLAGLQGARPGPVWYGDELVQHVPVERRRVGYVAQGFSLFPRMSVWRHLTFAGATPELGAYWIEHLRLEGLEDRLPAELSGGQRQRVGLAQVLCSSPLVLLLDEPFSALDVPVRLELRRELRRLQHEIGLATVLVTHDPEEAAFLSDELIVLGNGVELQSGTSRSVFSRPASVEVAKLLGVENLNTATVRTSSTIEVGGGQLRVPDTEIDVGAQVWWSIAPECVRVSSHDSDSATVDNGSILGTVLDVADLGSTYDIFVTVAGGGEVLARTRGALEVDVGSRCRIDFEPTAISLWEAPGDLSGRVQIVATP
ncbi:MAG TPA: ATP-binding cassette domain-containing protein, partial [Acidimicrobiales bacterium]|nr:ATP-binding cassette domain-containing protein [Acidimicrobiales bacterium]